MSKTKTGMKKMTADEVKRLATEDELELYSYVTDRAGEVSREIIGVVKGASSDKGGLVIVYGPQNSGKTIMACMVVEGLEGNDKTVIAAQPDVDRSDVPRGRYLSRSGVEKKVVSFKSKAQIEKIFADNDVVIVDEFHFIPHEIQSYFLKEAEDFVDRGGWVIVVGIVFTSQGAEFVLPALMKERADFVFEMTSTCQKCGQRGARYNQRLVDGRPTAAVDPELWEPSERVVYEPRCGECQVVLG